MIKVEAERFRVFRILNVAKLFFTNILGLILGVGITLLLSYRLGVTDQADAYVMARRLITGFTEILHRAMLTGLIPLLAVCMFVDGVYQPKTLTKWGWRMLAGGLALFAVIWATTPAIVSGLGAAMSTQTQSLAILATRLMALSLPFVILANLYTSALYLRGSFGVPSLLRQVPRLIVLLTFLTVAQSVLVPAAAFAFALGNSLLLAGCLWRVRRHRHVEIFAPGTSRKGQPVGSVWALSIFVVGDQAASWIAVYFAVQVGEGALTILELSVRIATLIAGAFTVSAIMPYLTTWSKGAAHRTPRSFGNVLWAGIVFLIGLQGYFLLNAQAIVDLLFSKSPLSPADLQLMVSIVAAISVAPLAVYLNQIFFVWNIASARSGLLWLILGSVLASLTVRLGLAIGLVDEIGVHALVLGMELGPLAAALVMMTFGDRGFWPERFPLRRAALIGSACILVLLGMSAGQPLSKAIAPELSIIPSSVLSLTISGLLGGGLFAVLAWRLQLIQYLRSKGVDP